MDQNVDCLQANLKWLANVQPELANQVAELTEKDVVFRFDSVSSDYDLYFKNERVLEGSIESLEQIFNLQLESTDGIAMPRLHRNFPECSNAPGNILSAMVDKHHELLSDFMPALPYKDDPLQHKKPPYRNLLVMGSLMLSPLLSYLKQVDESPWVSITVVEDDVRQLQAMLSLVDMPTLVNICKKRSISFVWHVDANSSNLRDRIYSQLSTTSPTFLFGWQILRSPVQSPALMELRSWLHAPEGAAQNMLAMLGFATDEINQSQQALWNAVSQQTMHILSSDILTEDTPIVVVASGPSLDSNIEWLKQHCQHFNIVAAGSALGTLLKAGIRPSVALFLERGSEVYSDLCTLLVEGYTLKDIFVFVSSTIDPRVPALFDRAAFYHRPVAAATELFPNDQNATMPISGPHVINSAVETMLCLGSREILLVGADFGAVNKKSPRSLNALGVSPRDFTIPVKGSRGRTIFSEPELLHTGYLLNRVILSFPGCKVFRLGEGIVMSSTKNVEESNELAAQFARSPNALRRKLSNLPVSSFSKSECSIFFDSVEKDLSKWVEEVYSSVHMTDGWCKSIADAISPLLLRLNMGDSRERKFITRILSQPLFFICMQLYDVSVEDTDQFKQRQYDFLKSVDLLASTLLFWLSVMRPWLSAQQLPSWNPEWLRQHYQVFSSQNI
ncbi:6-hydroxymethylpterin diphosphokinase MptE-like protein [Synechococcus sp. A18-25c]|uniref:motility associated factor glycosyltransferase family protein n=1 Tax=Synechococcus sp. A18-25c TaxID=1866938 RepID=UPI0016445548|nr:6-hydroxymethylpterin diphosphokinase MptE-like protein [Synechococcus sp. A18-25c]